MMLNSKRDGLIEHERSIKSIIYLEWKLIVLHKGLLRSNLENSVVAKDSYLPNEASLFGCLCLCLIRKYGRILSKSPSKILKVSVKDNTVLLERTVLN